MTNESFNVAIDAPSLDFRPPSTTTGCGRPDGALHGVAPVSLMAHVLNGLARRNGVPVEAGGDEMLRCVAAGGEPGADIAPSAALVAWLVQCVAVCGPRIAWRLTTVISAQFRNSWRRAALPR